jgi:hypothetical protein
LYLAGRLNPAAARRPPHLPSPWPFPAAAQLAAFSGSLSDEAEVMLTAAVEDGALVLKRRPDTTIKMTAVEPDVFRGSIGTITFRRDAAGKVNALSVKQERVWDLHFERRP